MARAIVFISFVLSQVLFATALSAQRTTHVQLRMGMSGILDSANYHYVRVHHDVHKVVMPDAGYLDFGNPKAYREFFVGVGYKIIERERFVLVGELYLTQAVGDTAHGARFIDPSIEARYRFTDRLVAEVSVIQFVPVGHNGESRTVVEKAKLDHEVFPSLGFGFGLGADKFGREHTEHKPFLSATFRPMHGKMGAIEAWWQRAPHSRHGQLQLMFIF